MDRAGYEDYVAAFNGRDYERLGSYYADDVEFILSRERGLVFHGRQAILDLYRPFHGAVHVSRIPSRVRRGWSRRALGARPPRTRASG